MLPTTAVARSETDSGKCADDAHRSGSRVEPEDRALRVMTVGAADDQDLAPELDDGGVRERMRELPDNTARADGEVDALDVGDGLAVMFAAENPDRSRRCIGRAVAHRFS